MQQLQPCPASYAVSVKLLGTNQGFTMTGGRINCSDIALKVSQALHRLDYSQLAAVTCHSKGSTVVLQGTIPSYYLKQIAQSVAAKVAGVTEVVNEIQVSESAL